VTTSDTTLTLVRGRVKWFDGKKGFGFITNASEEDVFVHFTMIDGEGFRQLRAGDRVKYVQTQGPKGLSATHVRRLAKETHVERPRDARPLNEN
jgi:cold shock protein